MTFAVATVDRYWLIGGDEDGTKHHVDVRFLDRVLATEPTELVLAVGDARARFAMTPRIAVELATQLMPYTRAAPLTRPDAYADAKRRLALAAEGKRDNGALFVYLGTHDVFATGEHVSVGERKFRRDDIVMYADARTRLPIKHWGCSTASSPCWRSPRPSESTIWSSSPRASPRTSNGKRWRDAGRERDLAGHPRRAATRQRGGHMNSGKADDERR